MSYGAHGKKNSDENNTARCYGGQYVTTKRSTTIRPVMQRPITKRTQRKQRNVPERNVP